MQRRFFSLFLLLNLCFTFTLFPLPAAAENSIHLQDVSFFGDSTTYGMIRYIAENDGHLGKPVTKLSRDQILTPPDGTFYLRNLPTTKVKYQGQNLPLSAAFRTAAPKILVITVGVNGLPHWTENSFKELYTRLLKNIQEATPSTQIALQSVYPTAKERAEHLSAFTVDKVDCLNEWIQAIAEENNLVYIDTAPKLKGVDGWLRPELQNGDGLHLNTAGFNIVLDSVATALNLKG